MDLRPSDILIERFEAWKNVASNLVAYFEGEAAFQWDLAGVRARGLAFLPGRGGATTFLGLTHTSNTQQQHSHQGCTH